MNQDTIQPILQISKIHEQRLLEALAIVEPMFPFNAEKVLHISQPQFFALETLTSRFARLQDLIGSKLFDLCLLSMGEAIDGLSMIDKANKLEKSSILYSTHAWLEMRKLRNNLTHEYPDKPEITAQILNQLHATITPMLSLYNKIVTILESSD